jgi:integrase
LFVPLQVRLPTRAQADVHVNAALLSLGAVSPLASKVLLLGQRWLPVPDELMDEMAALCPLEDRTSERRVFGVTDNAIRRGIELACQDAKIAHYSPHDLRHRRISLWVAQGFDPITVKGWSGHSRASMTLDVYSHVVTADAGDEWADFWRSVYAQTAKIAALSP